MPSQYSFRPPKKDSFPKTDPETPKPDDRPFVASGFFRGALFAIPLALILWALIILGVRLLLHWL